MSGERCLREYLFRYGPSASRPHRLAAPDFNSRWVVDGAEACGRDCGWWCTARTQV